MNSPRGVNKLGLVDIHLSRSTGDDSSAALSFDFLDHLDGGVVKILTEGDCDVKLTGAIIGMPKGIKRSDQIGRSDILNRLGCGFGIIFQISALASAIYTFYWVTGSWENLWLLALPFIAIVLPVIIVGAIGTWILPSTERILPSSLALPEWFTGLQNYYRRRPPVPHRDADRFLEIIDSRIEEKHKEHETEGGSEGQGRI